LARGGNGIWNGNGTEALPGKKEVAKFTSIVVGHARSSSFEPATTHPIFGDDLRALRRLQREQYPRSPFVIDADIEISYRRDIDECIAASAELQQLTGCRRDDKPTRWRRGR
jgi:hypothetical protein